MKTKIGILDETLLPLSQAKAKYFPTTAISLGACKCPKGFGLYERIQAVACGRRIRRLRTTSIVRIQDFVVVRSAEIFGNFSGLIEFLGFLANQFFLKVLVLEFAVQTSLIPIFVIMQLIGRGARWAGQWVQPPPSRGPSSGRCLRHPHDRHCPGRPGF